MLYLEQNSKLNRTHQIVVIGVLYMNSYYLVDYEYVGNEGFIGAEKLLSEDTVLIFYTNNAKKIDLDVLLKCRGARVEAIKVPAGKQSADMHIGTYLGFLAGKNREMKSNYIILSKDTDYDKIVQFLMNEENITVCRREQIKETNLSIKEPHSLKCEVQQSLSKAVYSDEVMNDVTSDLAKNYGVKNGKQQIYRSIISKYGQDKGLKIYTTIKKSIQ